MATVRMHEVTLKVSGPVKVKSQISFDTLKELNLGEIFRSGIQILPHKEGFEIIVTVYTSQPEKANKIALLFAGKMLDILAIKINVPLFVSLVSDWQYTRQTNQRTVLQKSDFQSAFAISRPRDDVYATCVRGLSWYRKALYTEDPYDKFFAFWLSIEIISNKCNPNRENCIDQATGRQKGSICNIWECFKHLWGECEEWEIIKGNKNWIDENTSIRNQIGHGTFAVDIVSVEEIIQKIDILQQVSNKFLSDWFNKKFHINLD